MISRVMGNLDAICMQHQTDQEIK